MSVKAFAISSFAAWADMDANAHMANVAYLSKCVDARMSFFKQHGFEVGEFTRRRIGPVVRRDELEYFREVGLLEPITVTLELAGLAPDGSRFRLRNEVLNGEGKVAARITSEGGLREASVMLGKFLSPRLYVHYGFGLFEAASTLRLRYTLSRLWSLGAEVIREENRAQIQYSTEW